MFCKTLNRMNHQDQVARRTQYEVTIAPDLCQTCAKPVHKTVRNSLGKFSLRGAAGTHAVKTKGLTCYPVQVVVQRLLRSTTITSTTCKLSKNLRKILRKPCTHPGSFDTIKLAPQRRPESLVWAALNTCRMHAPQNERKSRTHPI